MLGVNVTTIYAYVTRKRIRSTVVPGARERRYWKADIDRLRNKEHDGKAVIGELPAESEITLITERGPYYRGQSAVDLSRTATLEQVAALLWDADEAATFGEQLPVMPREFAALLKAMPDASTVDRASALFPFFEQANPSAYDLSPGGMARTGAQIMRLFAALILRSSKPSTRPLHEQIGGAAPLDRAMTDLIRRLLVLAADHGFEQGTYAVRATASTGVTPWRSVLTGLSIATGRRSRFGHFDGLRRFVAEILTDPDPLLPVIRRIKDAETVPGFDSPVYAGGDPRGLALLEACREALDGDPAFARFQAALDLVAELKGEQPNFAIVSTFVTSRLGAGLNQVDHRFAMGASSTPFLLGRSAGWIAHAIEQYGRGETERRPLLYKGPLPQPN
jgi:citrate synthase